MVTESSESYKFPLPSQIITQKGSKQDREKTKYRKEERKKKKRLRKVTRGEKCKRQRKRARERAQLLATEEESKIKHWANMTKQDITTNLKRKGQCVKVILTVCDPMK